MLSFDDYLKSTSLGLDRSLMPQIKQKDLQKFIKFIIDKDVGVRQNLKIPPEQLKPTQQTYADRDVYDIVANSDFTHPILISKDLYIIDGHHRWLAASHSNRDSVLCVMIDQNIQDALNTAREFENQ